MPTKFDTAQYDPLWSDGAPAAQEEAFQKILHSAHQMMAASTPLPDTFYELPAVYQRHVALHLAHWQEGDLTSHMLSFMLCDDFSRHLGKLQFLYDCLTVTCCLHSFPETLESEALLKAYLQTADAYLHSFYAYSLIREKESWHLLPPLHYATLLLLAAGKGQKAERLTRAAAVYPRLERMIAYYLEDHTTDEEPETAQQFAALVERCRFSHEQEAVDALSRRFRAIHPIYQMSLRDYWQKHSQWGGSVDAVVRRCAVTLTNHIADLERLFDMLSDETSRCLLLAIVTLWRRFDPKPLEELIKAAPPLPKDTTHTFSSLPELKKQKDTFPQDAVVSVAVKGGFDDLWQVPLELSRQLPTHSLSLEYEGSTLWPDGVYVIARPNHPV